ncbi:MAG: TIGR00300 family protein, partial [Phycisphaerae bacterium]|nr:TIGR00300 family protein [Phycisphaerae bacterium]
PAAFGELSLRHIEKRVPPEKRVVVGEADALRFCCNAVVLGDTVIVNHASPQLKARLAEMNLETVVCPLDEFILAGGAAKCLSLKMRQDVPGTIDARPRATSGICTSEIQLSGHLLDTAQLNLALDRITEAGGSFRIHQFTAGLRRDQPSTARILVAAPGPDRLEHILNNLMSLGVVQLAEAQDVRLEAVEHDGVAPEDFYSTTIYPTEVRVGGAWVQVGRQRMDAMIVVRGEGDGAAADCVLMRDLSTGDRVICGVEGVRVQTPPKVVADEDFAFMGSGVSSERRVERVVEELAWEMQRIRKRNGKIAVVAGPVVIHTGGGRHLSQLVRGGYVQTLLTGNALPVHDIELNMFGTSLGVDLARGVGVRGGHQNHLRAINRVRGAGSIATAVEQGLVTGGVMYECVQKGVPVVAAGSIRDDGPLPETIMDLCEAQQAYAEAIEGAEMILMLSSMLHAIGTGNMTPAGVRLICVDISPAVVTKLADRGSVESTGIVTDVGLFLNLLARRLCPSDAP